MLLGVATLETRRLQIGDGIICDSAQLPDVVRPAERVQRYPGGARQFRFADRLADRNARSAAAGRVRYDIHGFCYPSLRKVIQIVFLVDDLAGLEESVVIPVLEYVAFQVEHAAIGGVADVVDPWTAFGVAPADNNE